MRRQVGTTRRSRPQRPASSGAVRNLAETRPEDQPPPYPVAPHDLTLERELAGALAGWKHHGPLPDPADFYDVTFGRIAGAFVTQPGRMRYATAVHLERGDGYIYAYTYEGLADVLTELGDDRPRLTAFYAGIIAAEAPVTHGGDVAKLARLAHVRRRLIAIETERTELLELAKARQ